MSIATSTETRRHRPLLAQTGLWAMLLLALLALAGPLLTPMVNANMILSSRNLHGLGLLGPRLTVVAGWLAQLLMLRKMGKNHLPQRWLNLLLAFFWLTGSRVLVFQPQFWGGLTAMASVLAAWNYLQSLYNGKTQPRWISLSACLCAIVFWITPGLGLCLALAGLAYSLFHCFLHEREEKGLAYRKVDKLSVLKRWAQSWGRFGVLPWLAVQTVFALVLFTFVLFNTGAWPEFLPRSLPGLISVPASPPGYYASFHLEFIHAIQALEKEAKNPQFLLSVLQIPVTLHLLLIGVLPVTGILGMWYQLPDRLHYRLLQRQDDELLLLLLAAMALIGATMLSDSTAQHIVSNGGVAFLLGFIVIHRAVLHKPKAEKRFFRGTAIFCGLVLLGAVATSLALLLL